MSATLAVASRSYFSATLLSCSSPLRLKQHRHALPPASSARAYSSDDVVHRSRQKKNFRIQTLHPSRLRSSDLMDVSYICLGCRSEFRGSYYGLRPFPEVTRGFLYYNSPKAGDPPAAGELRFRLIPGNTPASFVQGSDLQLETGLPWCIPLLTMFRKSEWFRGEKYQIIRQLLLDDGFVTPPLLETCAAMLNTNKRQPQRDSRIIHSFGQLFHIRFDMVNFYFFTLSMDQLQYHYLEGFYYDKKSNPLYSGSALCCFERSNLPQHKGTRTVVVRIVKIISPVTCLYPNYNGPIPLPAEGELVQRNYQHRGLQPLAYNVDLRKHKLQMLFQDKS